MNICVCTVQVPFVKGGAETMVENLVLALKDHGHAVELINIPFKWYPKEQIIRDCLIWQLLDITESYFKTIDLVIATKFPSYFVRHPHKVVWMTHQFREIYDCYGTALSGFTCSEGDDTIRRTIARWDGEVLSQVQHLYTISRNVSRRLLHYNGIESKHLYVPPKLIGQYLPPRYGDFIFCPGRLEVSKRVDLLIRSMALLPSGISCRIAGTGPQEQTLKKLAVELSVTDRVTFCGYLSDEELLEYYSQAFAVFFAPYDEDLGLITLEAFHARKPVITCPDAGAVLEFVEHERSGLIVEKEPEEIARAIQTLADDKGLCQAMGEHGYDAISTITWDKVVTTLLQD